MIYRVDMTSSTGINPCTRRPYLPVQRPFPVRYVVVLPHSLSCKSKDLLPQEAILPKKPFRQPYFAVAFALSS
jgi:hypothetical protein